MSVAILLSARRRPRPRLALLLLTLLLIAASLVHLGLGARWIAPQTVLQALLEYDPRNFEQRIIIDLRLVRLAAAEPYRSAYPVHWGARVEAVLSDGTRHSAARTDAKGDPEAPLSRAEMIAKAEMLMRLGGLAQPGPLIEAILAMAEENAPLPSLILGRVR